MVPATRAPASRWKSSTKIGGVTIDNGGVTIASGQTLTLDNDTLNNVGITDNGSVHVDSGRPTGAFPASRLPAVRLETPALSRTSLAHVTLTNTTLNGGQVTIDVTLPNLTATDQGTVVQFTGSGFDATRVFSPAVAEVNGPIHYAVRRSGVGQHPDRIGDIERRRELDHQSVEPGHRQ